MKNKFKFITLITFLVSVFWYGCQEEAVSPDADSFSIPRSLSNASGGDLLGTSDCKENKVADLYAGAGKNDLNKGEDVGDVFLYFEDDLIKVKYIIDEESDWSLAEAHLWIGTADDEIQDAAPGQFPYKEEFDAPKSEHIFEIDPGKLGLVEGEVCGAELKLATHAVVIRESNDCEASGIVYGLERETGDVYAVDVVEQSAWKEFSTVAPPTGSAKPNGLAYDGENERMYYCTYQSSPTTLYFWDYTNSTPQEIVSGSLGGVQIAAADFYDGKYYYITGPPASDNLYEVEFDADGIVISYNKIADIAEDAHGWTFNGDIAIKDGIIFGWGKCGVHNKYEFFTYDLDGAGFNLTTTAYQTFSMQLAFGSNGILYGHKSDASGNAYFYEVDITNGDLSNETLIDPDLAYTDCASGVICVPEYETETAWGYDPDFPNDGNCAKTFVELGISKKWGGVFCAEVCCPCDEWIIYGSNLGTGTGSDAIYAYDLNAKTQTLVYDPGSIDADQNYPNGNAYDPVSQRIYTGTKNGRFFYYDIDDGSWKQLTTNENFGTMACGAWYDGNYYYVQNGTSRLYKVSISGTTATRDQIGTVPTSNGYGDIAFDPANPGVFIGSAGSPTATWYWYNTNNGGSKGTLTRSGGVAKHLQLAYGSNGVLYGVEALSGQFYTIEYDASNVTLTADWDSPYTFTDLASGPQCQ